MWLMQSLGYLKSHSDSFENAQAYEADVLSNQAILEYELDEVDKAVSDADEAIKMSPNNETYYNHAHLMDLMGNSQKATDDLKEFISLPSYYGQSGIFHFLRDIGREICKSISVYGCT